MIQTFTVSGLYKQTLNESWYVIVSLILVIDGDLTLNHYAGGSTHYNYTRLHIKGKSQIIQHNTN